MPKVAMSLLRASLRGVVGLRAVAKVLPAMGPRPPPSRPIAGRTVARGYPEY